MADHPVAIPTHRKILYLVVIMTVVLAICEIAVRTRQWIRYGGFAVSVRDPMLEYDPKADLLVPKPGYEVKGGRLDIKINSLGFRGDEFERRKRPHSVRIAPSVHRRRSALRFRIITRRGRIACRRSLERPTPV